MPKRQTPYGIIDVDARGNVVDSPATRAAMAASQAANPQAGGNGPQAPTPEQAVSAGQEAGTTTYNPGNTPDYQSLIESDPIYQQQKADLSAQGISDAAQRKAATNRALINFGEVPDLQSAVGGLGLDPNSPMFKMLFSDVDPMTQRGAQDMTHAGYSTMAQLNRAHETNMNDLLSQLAARGSLHSGATGVGTGLEGDRFGKASFDARSNLLDYLAGLQSAFTASERTRQGALAQGATDATGRQIALHPATGPTGEKPTGTATGAPPTVQPSGDPAPPVLGAPQSTTFGGTAGPYIGTMSTGVPGVPKPAAPKSPMIDQIVSRLNWQR